MWTAACRELRGLSYDGPARGANSIVVYSAAWYLLVGASTGVSGIAYAWAIPGALLCLLGLQHRQVWSRGRGLLAGGLLLLALPLLWRPALTGDAWRADTRVACTAMGVILLAWLSAQRPPLRTARQCGWLILLAGLVCVLAVLRQTYWPAAHALWMPSVADGRPSGTFHQNNVMASFLATGLAVTLHLWLSGRQRVALPAALAGGVAVVAFAVTGARVAAAYDVANRTTGLVVQPLIQARAWDPWYDPEAVGYALMLHDIRVYGANHDPALPGRIATFLQGYLVHHPDPNAYTMYLAVLHLEGQEATYQRVLKEARWRVAWDPRYASAGTLRDGTTPPSAKATHEDDSSTKGE